MGLIDPQGRAGSEHEYAQIALYIERVSLILWRILHACWRLLPARGVLPGDRPWPCRPLPASWPAWLCHPLARSVICP